MRNETMKHLLVLSLTSLIVAACGTPLKQTSEVASNAPSHTDELRPATPEEAAELLAHDRKFADLFNSRDAIGCAEMYSETAVFTNLAGIVLNGRTEIEADLSAAFASFEQAHVQVTLEAVRSSAQRMGDSDTYLVNGEWKLTTTTSDGSTKEELARSTAVIQGGIGEPLLYVLDQVSPVAAP